MRAAVTSLVLIISSCRGDTSVAPDAGADAAIPDAAAPTYVTCGQALPGPTLAATTVEGEPGYPGALAALDLSTVTYPIDLSTENAITRAVANYVVGVVGQMQITEAQVTAAGELGTALVAAVAFAGDQTVDLKFLRRGLYYFAPCARKLPVDLAAFTAKYGDWEHWPSRTIACSAPKNGPRKIYSDPEGRAFVAETIVGTDVRETEVLMMDNRSDGQIDFAAYTSDGMLTDRSTFATASSTVVASAPYTCMACHYDSDQQRYTDLTPTGTGAGCRIARAHGSGDHFAGELAPWRETR